jgi:hypothetical protein
MSAADRANQRARSTLTEYERAEARVTLFRAIEEHARVVVEDLQNCSPEDWAARWFARKRWAVRQARATKSVWADAPARRSGMEFLVFPKGMMAGIRHRRFGEFEYQSWNPLSEDKSKAKERLRAEFIAHLKAEMDEYADEIGYKRQRFRANLERNARWLVLYQFSEKTYGKIAQTENRGKNERDVSPNKVHKAVEAFAQLIDLPLRKGNRRGRPFESQ